MLGARVFLFVDGELSRTAFFIEMMIQDRPVYSLSCIPVKVDLHKGIVD